MIKVDKWWSLAEADIIKVDKSVERPNDVQDPAITNSNLKRKKLKSIVALIISISTW